MELETLTITKQDGKQTLVSDISGAALLSVTEASPQPAVQYQQLAGADGNIDQGTTFNTKTITATFYLGALDKYDWTLAVHDIWRLLFDYQAYYITWSRMPGIRYLVHCQPFDFTVLNEIEGTFQVQFDAFLGHGESVGRTDTDPIDLNSDVWQMIGQGAFPLDEDLSYDHTESSFQILNAGDLPINPRQNELTITIKGTGTPTLTNETTGETFVYNDELADGDELVIDGVFPMLNGTNCGRSTNHGLISLATGWNAITISGLTNPEVIFGTRFLYK